MMKPSLNLSLAEKLLSWANWAASGYGHPRFAQHILYVRSQTLAEQVTLPAETRELLDTHSVKWRNYVPFGTEDIEQFRRQLERIPDPPAPAAGLALPTAEAITRGAMLLEKAEPLCDLWPMEHIFGALGIWYGYTSPYTMDVIMHDHGLIDAIGEETPKVLKVLNRGYRERQGITLDMLVHAAVQLYDRHGDEIAGWKKRRSFPAIGRIIGRSHGAIYKNLSDEPFLMVGIAEIDQRVLPLFRRHR